jgi:hypothetical protein
MSRLDVAGFVTDVLGELPDVPEPLRTAIAKAALEPESKRVATIRKVLEESVGTRPAPDRQSRDA